MIRIIDNKKIELTESEFALYQKISKSYDRPNFKGEDLFKGLFETDKTGKIIFLIPPTGKYSSMEVYMFLMNVMVHQQLGDACRQVELLVDDAKKVIDESREILAKLKSVEKGKKK